MKKILLFVLALWNVFNINAQSYPDNVVPYDCFFPTNGTATASQTWAPPTMLVSDTIFHVTYSPIVGDIDQDGIVEVLISSDRQYKRVQYVLNGNDLTIIDSIVFVNKVINANDNGMAVMVRYPNADTMQGAIIFSLEEGTEWTASEIRRLVSYDKYGNLLNTSDVTTSHRATLSVTDFNNDGFPELYEGGVIFDVATLKRLCLLSETENSGKSLIFDLEEDKSFAANVLGDEKLELICGNCIYNVNIVSRTNVAANSITLNKTITPPNGFPTDGHSLVADFNHDGQLDVMVISKVNAGFSFGDGTLYMYAYDPVTNAILFHETINSVTWYSIPSIGDINGDGDVDFVIAFGGNSGSNDFMNAYTCQVGGLSLLWSEPHGDDTGASGTSLFDFNQDGTSEILYRDEDFFSIFNGSGRSHLTGTDTIDFYPIFSTDVLSGTGYEYPIVADVDNDGYADILVQGKAMTSRHYYSSYLKRFSAGDFWAPARPVWNQFLYNVVNVNKDVTIPTIYYDPARIFVDPDDPTIIRQPFNNFLQQATTLDIYGIPHYDIFPLTDAALNPDNSSIRSNCDSVLIQLSYSNFGDSTLNAPYHIMLYKDNYGGDLIFDFTMDDPLEVDESHILNINFTESDLIDFLPIENLVFAINDESAGIGQEGGLQEECDLLNNMLILPNVNFVHVGDTVIFDTICQGTPYTKNGFFLNSSQTDQAGTFYFENIVPTPSECDSTVSLALTTKPCEAFLYFPNSISPSRNDGLNDVFSIPEVYRESILDIEILIYNRWGEQVFRSIDKNFEWDGRYNDIIYSNTVYVFVAKIVTIDGKPNFYKGSITVL